MICAWTGSECDSATTPGDRRAGRVEPYTDPGTAVRVVERRNPLYPQIGTLKDTVPVDLLAVPRPSDRTTLWRFHPDELDHVLPVELRPRRRAPNEPPEPLNQITPLYHYLNEASILGFGEWCFTGSLAVTPGLGSLDRMILLWASMPVVPLEQLRTRKKEILDEIGIDEEELAKATGDLKTIEALSSSNARAGRCDRACRRVERRPARRS